MFPVVFLTIIGSTRARVQRLRTYTRGNRKWFILMFTGMPRQYTRAPHQSRSRRTDRRINVIASAAFSYVAVPGQI